MSTEQLRFRGSPGKGLGLRPEAQRRLRGRIRWACERHIRYQARYQQIVEAACARARKAASRARRKHVFQMAFESGEENLRLASRADGSRRKITQLPSAMIDAYLSSCRSARRIPTEKDCLSFARRTKLKVRREIIAQESDRAIDNLTELAEACASGLSPRFRCIYLDPPWHVRGAKQYYPTMSVEQIEALPIRDLAAEECHLHLWTTNGLLPEALQLMASWGFTYRNCVPWIKPGRLGVGFFYRGAPELLLLGVRGKLPFQSHSIRGVIKAATGGEHSGKPEVARRNIEQASPGPRIELFARQTAPGWVSWGNEIGRDGRPASR